MKAIWWLAGGAAALGAAYVLTRPAQAASPVSTPAPPAGPVRRPAHPPAVPYMPPVSPPAPPAAPVQTYVVPGYSSDPNAWQGWSEVQSVIYDPSVQSDGGEAGTGGGMFEAVHHCSSFFEKYGPPSSYWFKRDGLPMNQGNVWHWSGPDVWCYAKPPPNA
jgi:hypothetical protein